MSSNPATIKDIARKLNLHHTTVSRALRNHPDVNQETRHRVLKTAEQMNYTPNSYATNLRARKSKTIGIIVPSVQPFFFSSIISILSQKAEKTGFSIMICQSDDKYEIEKRNVMTLLQNRVAGLFVSLASETETYEHFDFLEKQEVPVVFFDRVPNTKKSNHIKIDNFHGAYQATEYLISNGRKDIAFLTGPRDVSTFHDRLKGYIAALRDNGLNVHKQRILRSELSIAGGKSIMQQIASREKLPDALLCSVDLLAFGAMNIIHKSGLKIPDDIALIGFDNHPAGEIVQPALTTLAQPIEQIGSNSYEMLMSIINKRKLKKDLTIPLKMKLLLRASA